MSEQIEPSINLTPAIKIVEALFSEKKVRGRNKATIKLIDAMHRIAEEARPITGRGIGYKLFTAGLISGMSEMPKVYRALKVAREDGTIPWEWIIDETRELELISTWNNPQHCANGFFYRRDLWQTQPKRVEVWSEKGTVRGVLWPVLPWTSEETETCFIVRDSTGRALAYVYYEEEPGRRTSANLLTKDEARRIASNIAKLPKFRMGGAAS